MDDVFHLKRNRWSGQKLLMMTIRLTEKKSWCSVTYLCCKMLNFRCNVLQFELFHFATWHCKDFIVINSNISWCVFIDGTEQGISLRSGWLQLTMKVKITKIQLIGRRKCNFSEAILPLLPSKEFDKTNSQMYKKHLHEVASKQK